MPHVPQPTPEELYQRSLQRTEEIHLTYTTSGVRECKEPCFHHSATLDRHKDMYDPRSDYTHIWEMPLPHEPQKKLTLQPNV